MARLQIAQRLEQLRRPLDSTDLWAFFAVCNQCRGALIQTVSATESALAAWLGVPVELDLSADLENSIQVRRAYQQFHRAVRAGGEPTLVQVHDRLRQTDEAAAQLIDSPFFRELRVADRAQLRRLKEQMAAWLEAGAMADPLTGLHLWCDVQALAELLLQVNNRHDLIEHDRAALLRLLDLLYNRSSAAESTREDVARELSRIAGRDFDLDQLVEQGEPLTSAAFIKAVTRAAVRLAAGEANRVLLGELS